MEQSKETYTLEQLCALAELPKRTVRYYIQQGLVDRPCGEKRGSYYTRRHLDALIEIRRWQREGLSLTRIAELMAEAGAPTHVPPPARRPGEVTVWSHLFLGEGIELHVEPKAAGLGPEQLRELVQEITTLIGNLNREKGR